MNKQRTKHPVLSWEVTGAVCCFAGGIAAALVGSVLTPISWILGAQLHQWLHGLGTAFLIVTIPLLIFSGYCLDWMERDQNDQVVDSDHREQGRLAN